MAQIIDSRYLREDQYRDSTNLDKRASLHDRFSTNPTGWFPWMAKALDFPAQARLLEIGAGPGYLWISQGSRLPAGWEVILSDFSPGMVAQARLGLAPSSRAYQFSVLDAQSLPFASQSFDGVIANHMLYHVPDRQRALAEIRRVLRPGGKLLAATNGKDHLLELYGWIARATEIPLPELRSFLLGFTLPFNLENGREQLEKQFSRVELSLYPDALEITQVEPLVNYVQSMLSSSRKPEILQAIPRLRVLWEAEIQTRGSVYISKHSGLFIART